MRDYRDEPEWDRAAAWERREALSEAAADAREAWEAWFDETRDERRRVLGRPAPGGPRLTMPWEEPPGWGEEDGHEQ